MKNYFILKAASLSNRVVDLKVPIILSHFRINSGPRTTRKAENPRGGEGGKAGFPRPELTCPESPPKNRLLYRLYHIPKVTLVFLPITSVNVSRTFVCP